MLNVTKAVFKLGSTMAKAFPGLWQYDHGQILLVEGLALPATYEVHFANYGSSRTFLMIGTEEGVSIP